MQGVITRLAGLGLAVTMTLTAGGAVAVFTAGGPGEDLSPSGHADRLIDLTQGSRSVLWTSLAGNVATIRTMGWPSSDGVHDLGGALMIETPSDPTAGAIAFGERPMSVEFALES